jgi:ParB family chromosome partitioning protein
VLLGQIVMTDQERETVLANELDIVELTSRIREEGLIQPVVLRQTADGQYRIIAGHLRVEACKRLGWRSLPAIVRKEE